MILQTEPGRTSIQLAFSPTEVGAYPAGASAYGFWA